MITKTIYQTFYTKKNLPDSIISHRNKMMELNPNYTYELFDDDDIEEFFLNEFDDETFQIYKKLNVGAAKADFWRYCVLYKKGGVYIDMDSIIYNNIDLIIDDNDSAIISRESHKGVFLQWCLMFAPNHPILDICIQKCKENIKNKSSDNLLHVTGPHVYTSSIYEYCKDLGKDVWSTSDYEINQALKTSNFDLKVFSTDYRGICNFKHPGYSDLINFNNSNNHPHWTEKKDFIL